MHNKGMGGHQSASSRTNEWFTPKDLLIQLGEFDLDPCTSENRPWDTAKHHYTPKENGLIQPWFGRVFLNPPYSADQIPNWMKLMSEHITGGIALTFARTDTDWFYRYVFPAGSSIFFIKRRVFFCNIAGLKAKYDGGAPSVLIAYGEQNSQVLSEIKTVGHHVPLNYTPLIVVGVSPTWISVVTIAVRHCGDQELKLVYEMVERIAPDKVQANEHWKAKIRQQVQIIRKKKVYEQRTEKISC